MWPNNKRLFLSTLTNCYSLRTPGVRSSAHIGGPYTSKHKKSVDMLPWYKFKVREEKRTSIASIDQRDQVKTLNLRKANWRRHYSMLCHVVWTGHMVATRYYFCQKLVKFVSKFSLMTSPVNGVTLVPSVSCLRRCK